jgi:shikimate dehydrogenase
MKRLGVLGWPVAHSRSPAMHRAALAELGLDDWSYQLLPAPPEVFAETVRALPAAGFVGANVTIPHKEAALALATEATEAARAIGAANTLTFAPDGAIRADNTDAPGLLAALEGAGVDPRGRTALVLGAGGSARAAAHALHAAGADVALLNRTPERARAVAADLGVRVARGADEPAELLVHCTSIGLDGASSPLKEFGFGADAVGAFACVADLVYRADGDTGLIAAARARAVPVVDGLEILVRQGALSLQGWTGRTPPLDVMRLAARGRLQLRHPSPRSGAHPGPRPGDHAGGGAAGA